MKLSKRIIGLICVVAWLAFMLLSLLNWPPDSFGRLLAWIAILLLAHVFYAVYFATSRARFLSGALIFWLLVGGASALLVPFSFQAVWLNILLMCSLFAGGIGMHKVLLGQNVSASLNNLCRYKIKLETGIIGLSLVMGALIWLFPDYKSWFAGFSLIILIAANAKLLLIDQIYSKWR